MRRKLLPLFFVLLALFLFSPQLVLVHATSTYVGMVAGQVTGSTCPPTGGDCGGPGGTNGLNDNGDGAFIQAPFAGQIASVSIFTGAQLPNNVVILVGTTTAPAFTTYPVNGGGNGRLANAGYSATVKDTEVLSGLSTLTFTTIVLANPVTVTSGQWVAAVFTAACAFPSNCFEIMHCGVSASPSCHSTYDAGNYLDTGFSFGGGTGAAPAVNSNQNTINLGGDGDQFMVGITFQTVGSPSQFKTQCYGNCGSPAITLTNTNSTHTVNWNQSFTLFYQFTANANGFVNNVTVSASSFQPNNPTQLGLYVANCQSGQVPFTSSCPGFLQSQATFATLFKGKVSMATNIPVTNGESIGISVTGTSKGLDLNGTNVSLPIFQASGRTPSQIAFSSTFDGASQIGLWAWITGNVIINGPGGSGGFTSGGGCITCGLADFVNALGGGVFGGIVAFGIIFGIIAFGLLYATRIHHPKSEGGGIKGYGVPMELLTIFAVIILIGFSAAGVLPPWIPFLIIALVAWLFTQAIFGHRRGTTTEPV